MNAEELEAYFTQARAASGHQGPPCRITHLDDHQLRLAVDAGHGFTRAGGTMISGPALFSLIDSVGWLMSVAHSGPGTDAFTTDVSIQYLRPVHLGTVELVGTALKRGRRNVFEVSVDPDEDGPAVHAVIAFATRESAVLPA